MVDVVQLARTPDCGSGGHGFESHLSPHKVKPLSIAVFLIVNNLQYFLKIIFPIMNKTQKNNQTTHKGGQIYENSQYNCLDIFTYWRI